MRPSEETGYRVVKNTRIRNHIRDSLHQFDFRAMMTATQGRLFAVLEDGLDEVVSTLQTVPRRSTSISHTDQSMSPKIALLRKRFLSLSQSDRSYGKMDDESVEGDVFSDHLEKPWQSPLTQSPLNRVCRNTSTRSSSSPRSSYRASTPSFEEYSTRVEQIKVERSKCSEQYFNCLFLQKATTLFFSGEEDLSRHSRGNEAQVSYCK